MCPRVGTRSTQSLSFHHPPGCYLLRGTCHSLPESLIEWVKSAELVATWVAARVLQAGSIFNTRHYLSKSTGSTYRRSGDSTNVSSACRDLLFGRIGYLRHC